MPGIVTSWINKIFPKNKKKTETDDRRNRNRNTVIGAPSEWAHEGLEGMSRRPSSKKRSKRRSEPPNVEYGRGYADSATNLSRSGDAFVPLQVDISSPKTRPIRRTSLSRGGVPPTSSDETTNLESSTMTSPPTTSKSNKPPFSSSSSISDSRSIVPSFRSGGVGGPRPPPKTPNSTSTMTGRPSLPSITDVEVNDHINKIASLERHISQMSLRHEEAMEEKNQEIYKAGARQVTSERKLEEAKLASESELRDRLRVTESENGRLKKELGSTREFARSWAEAAAKAEVNKNDRIVDEADVATAKDLEEMAAELTTLQNELIEAEEETEMWKLRFEKAEERREEREEEIGRMERRHNERIEELAQAQGNKRDDEEADDEEKQTLRRQIVDLTATVTTLRSENQTALETHRLDAEASRVEISTLEETVRRNEVEEEEEGKESTLLQRQIEDLTTTISTLESDNATAVESHRVRERDLRSEIAALEDTVNLNDITMVDDLTELQELLAEKEAQLKTFESELEAYAVREAANSEEVERRIGEAVAEERRRAAQSLTTDAAATKLEPEGDDTPQSIAKTSDEDEVESLRGRLETLTTRLDAREQENKELRAFIETLQEASSSSSSQQQPRHDTPRTDAPSPSSLGKNDDAPASPSNPSNSPSPTVAAGNRFSEEISAAVAAEVYEFEEELKRLRSEKVAWEESKKATEQELKTITDAHVWEHNALDAHVASLQQRVKSQAETHEREVAALKKMLEKYEEDIDAELAVRMFDAELAAAAAAAATDGEAKDEN